MRSFLLAATLALVGMVSWAALVFIGTVEGWGRKPLAGPGDAGAFLAAARAEIDAHHHGNVAFRLIDAGGVAGEHFVSIGDPVDEDTLYQVASLSKWVTAWGVLALVEDGKLDLDAPVSSYLTRWTLPEGEFDNDGVTVRRLLSHTAGLTDGLGYAGFAPGVEPQTLEDSLTRAADASPGADGRVRVGIAPGSEWRYSGGGYTLLQLLVEEVTGASFETYMQEAVFGPLQMTRSTFVLEKDEENVATFYDSDGTRATHFRFTGLAAASLYTNASDMTRFLAAHRPGPGGEPAGGGVLEPETLVLMRSAHASRMGADIWGLGTMLYAPNNQEDFIIGHDGNNAPAINTAVRLNPTTGDGIVVLETGDPLLATRIAGEWVFWQTGAIDFLDFTLVSRQRLSAVLVGWALIVAAAVVYGWRAARARRTDSAATVRV
jgi:CubicO group peptidase (beta-lactamase class C family)